MSHFFQPIRTKEQLQRAISKMHFDCYLLCHKALGKYPRNAGNVGIFAHSDDEFASLIKIRDEWVKPSSNPNQKYYELREPIIIAQTPSVPQATYTHLYVRKPDASPYGQHSGDIDFFVSDEEFARLKSVVVDKKIPGAKIYSYPPNDMVEISDEKIAGLAYVSMECTTKEVHVRKS